MLMWWIGMPKLKIKQEISKSKEHKPRIKVDAPDVHWDDTELLHKEAIKALNDPKTPWIEVRTPRLSPAELNIQLRQKYMIPLSANRNTIQWYLDMIPYAVDGTTEEKIRKNMIIENHKYFLRRYAINGKEFDVCWLLLQEGI